MMKSRLNFIDEELLLTTYQEYVTANGSQTQKDRVSSLKAIRFANDATGVLALNFIRDATDPIPINWYVFKQEQIKFLMEVSSENEDIKEMILKFAMSISSISVENNLSTGNIYLLNPKHDPNDEINTSIERKMLTRIVEDWRTKKYPKFKDFDNKFGITGVLLIENTTDFKIMFTFETKNTNQVANIKRESYDLFQTQLTAFNNIIVQLLNDINDNNRKYRETLPPEERFNKIERIVNLNEFTLDDPDGVLDDDTMIESYAYFWQGILHKLRSSPNTIDSISQILGRYIPAIMILSVFLGSSK